MPIVQLKTCTIEGNIAQAYLDMQQHVSEVTQNILSQITSVSPPSLTQINNTLQQVLVASPTPLTPDEMSAQLGIPKLSPSDTDNEKRLTPLGMILVKTILYLADQSGNISAYRRLYFAVGGDMTTFLAIVNGSAPFALIQTYLNVQKLPVTQQWVLADVQKLYNNQAIEAVYTAADGGQYVVIPTYLGYNISAQQAATKAGVSVNQVVSQMFWLQSVTQNPATLSDLQDLGITNDFLAASLFGANLTTFKPSLLTDNQATVSIQTGQAVSQLQLLLTRFNQTSPQDRFTYRSEGSKSATVAQQTIYQQQQIVRFNATVLVRPQDIADFLKRNTTSDLAYLFSERLDVTGINFQATTQDVMGAITKALAIPAGSTTIASLSVNTPAPTIPNTIDTSNGCLIRNYCGILNSTLPGAVKYGDIEKAVSCLQQSLQPVPVATPSTVPIVGYSSWDSPSSTIAQQVNFEQTLNQDGLIAAIEADFTGLSIILTAIISVIVAMIKFVQTAINQIFTQFKQTIGGFVGQLQGTNSLFSSMFATQTLDLSILKCMAALGPLGPNLDALLADLTSLIESIQSKILALLGQVAKAIGDLIAELLCFIPNLLNQFITGIPNPIPSICQVNKVTLPANITDALNQLRAGFVLQSSTATAFSRDILKLSSFNVSLVGKLDRFQATLACESPASDAFTAASKQLLGILTIPNPLSGLGGAF